jgi:hypothetical protein
VYIIFIMRFLSTCTKSSMENSWAAEGFAQLARVHSSTVWGALVRDGACNKSWREIAPASIGPASRVTPSRSNLEHAENLSSGNPLLQQRSNLEHAENVSSGNPLLQQTTSCKYAMKLHRSPVQVDEAVGGPASHALLIALASCWRWRSRCAAVSMAMSLCSDS